MHLTIKQTKALDYLEDNVTKELEFGGGAGGGKSAFGCYWQIKRRLQYPGTRGLIGRSHLKTLKETTLNTFFQIAALQGLKAGVHYRYNQQSSIISFFNGSEILLKDLYLYPTDPNFDELGSLEITDAFVDENNQIVEKAWNIVKSRIRYKLDEYGLIPKMLGSCNPSKNWVYQRFYKPSKDGTLPPDKKFIQSLLTDNPHISIHYRDNLLALDKNSKERLLYGNWEYDDDPAVLMSFDSISDLFKNTFVPAGEKYMSVDVARKGQDRTVIMVWQGWRVEKIAVLQGALTNITVLKIKELQDSHNVPSSQIVIDEDGVGGGVVDNIPGCKGFVNNSRPLPNPDEQNYSMKGQPENYDNLKSQCYFRLAKRVNSRKIYVNCDMEVQNLLSGELGVIKQKDIDKDGKIRVIPKDEQKELLGRSPDFADALMMREYFTLQKQVEHFAI